MQATSFYKKQLKAVKASINCSERNTRDIISRADKVATALRTDNFSLADAVKTAYYRMLKTYTYDQSFTIAKESKKSEVIWERIAKAYEESGCTVDHYMRAQFQWFHAVFGTYPKITQLATPAAKERAKLYESTSTSSIMANAQPAKKDLAMLLRNSEKQMRALCEARSLSRREVYQQLVIPGLFMFPKEFLDSDPEYARCK